MSLSLGHVFNNYGFSSTFIGHIINIYGFIFLYMNPKTNKLDRIHCSYLADDNEFITTRLHEKG